MLAAAANSTESTTAVADRVPVYIVASAEEAVEFQRRLAALSSEGLPRDAALLVAGSAEEEARARLVISSLQERFGVGGVAVVDLRVPTAPRTIGLSACDGRPSPDAGITAC